MKKIIFSCLMLAPVWSFGLINWSAVQVTSGEDGAALFSTQGEQMDAHYFRDTDLGVITLGNGVAFEAYTDSGFSTTPSGTSFSGFDIVTNTTLSKYSSTFGDLVGGFAFGYESPAVGVLSFDTVIGQEYEVELLSIFSFVDHYYASTDDTTQGTSMEMLTFDAGSSIDEEGYLMTGTFTATETTSYISFGQNYGSPNYLQAALTAYQIRSLSQVPEPATYALLFGLFAFLGVGIIRRIRSSSSY